MASRIYTVPIDAVAATTAFDPWEFNAGSAAVVRLISAFLAQSTDFGDAEDEQLRIRIIRAASTSGSGGSTTTAQPMVVGDTAFTGTCETMNTTVATGGTPVVLKCDGFNIRAGWVYRPTEREILSIAPSGRLVINMPSTPTDSITFSGYAVIEEIT